MSTQILPASDSNRGPAGVRPAIDAAYEITRLPGGGWELRVDGSPIARVRRCASGWTVSGIFDRRAAEVVGTLEQAIEAATYRY